MIYLINERSPFDILRRLRIIPSFRQHWRLPQGLFQRTNLLRYHLFLTYGENNLPYFYTWMGRFASLPSPCPMVGPHKRALHHLLNKKIIICLYIENIETLNRMFQSIFTKLLFYWQLMINNLSVIFFTFDRVEKLLKNYRKSLTIKRLFYVNSKLIYVKIL